MKKEVSGADVLVREGWGQHLPPSSRSRCRVIAVMIAVVLGCGAAAVLVHSGSLVRHNAQPIEQTGIIRMPERTSGFAGADASGVAVPTNRPDGAGNGAGPPIAGADATTAETTSTESSNSLPTNLPASPPVGVPGTSPRLDPPTTTGPPTTMLGPTATNPPPPPPPPSSPPPPPPTSPKRTTPRPPPCWLIFC